MCFIYTNALNTVVANTVYDSSGTFFWTLSPLTIQFGQDLGYNYAFLAGVDFYLMIDDFDF
jgi:hypothetical protein